MKPMSHDEYARALDRLGFSNRDFCLNVVGVNDKTGRDWKSGETPVPGSVAALLRLMLKLKLSAEKYRELMG
ncbi:hypothetical protein AC629_40380 [Bradyrhizobium sp. NAS80.1]|uniref:hypothetical protein n=1 Tax=Bradyrhizobium sp. NAS80.1 TaxID=1680159 RepID=UPI000967FA0B|nr:hypothetical protein [Bradyrhizobium sp. NAS80.1]OKO70477.1 hypothetical protein AC629_40380 [Bradyrhizobium sp. NAS80.1]